MLDKAREFALNALKDKKHGEGALVKRQWDTAKHLNS